MSTDALALEKYHHPKPVILTVDDDPNNLAVLHDCLMECDYTILAAEDGESAIERAEYAVPDLILLDVMMPGIDGFETCRRLKSMAGTKDIPVIFMTALAETELKVKGLEAGAVDYITKPFQREEMLARIAVHLHNRQLTRELQETKDELERRVEERTTDLTIANCELEEEIAERQMAQEQLQSQALIMEEKVKELQLAQSALQKSEKRFRVIFEQTFQLIALLSPDGTLLEANDTGLNFCGVTAADVIGKPFWETPWWTYSEEQRQNLREGIATAAAGELVRFEVSYLHEKGKLFILDFSLKPVLDDQGNVTQMIAEGRDITDLKKMDKDLRQSQKMEAIGTLAGGIAHDFNNILTAIIGYTDMAQRKLTNIDPIARDLERAQEASNRAKELVSRILAFSRQAEQERKPLQMTTVIDEVFKLLRATLPTSIEIQQQFDTPLNGDMVLADSTQLHQVLMNLGTNAAQAMRASGGIITVSLTNIDVDTSLITLYPELTPGPYMRLTFSDNGHGMDAAVKERIFEPYFTTKKVGEGTGMGLSVVQGIIKSHGGTIGVYSEPGHGTTFNIFLPRASGEHLHDTPAETSVIGGSERILFVDDEEMLTELGQELLQALGYQVAAGTSSLEMLEHFRAQPDAFDLVITDMTMPGLTGRELAKELRAIRSDIPIVMCSGFTEFLSVAEVAEAGISEFMMKPYVARTLDQVIRRVLAP